MGWKQKGAFAEGDASGHVCYGMRSVVRIVLVSKVGWMCEACLSLTRLDPYVACLLASCETYHQHVLYLGGRLIHSALLQRWQISQCCDDWIRLPIQPRQGRVARAINNNRINTRHGRSFGLCKQSQP